MKIDPVTGKIPVKFGAEIVDLRFTNSAFCYIEEEARVDAAGDAIARFMDAALKGRVPFALVIPFARSFLRAAGKDPALVDAANRNELVAAVAALVFSVIELETGDASANPPKAAGSSSPPAA